MLDKALIGHATLTALCVAVAFSAWSTKPSERSAKEKPKLVSGNLGALQRVEWNERGDKDRETRVELSRGQDDALNVTVTESSAEGSKEPRQFPGSARAEELMEKLGRLEAERAIGTVEADEKEKFGLGKQTARSLTLSFEQRALELEVGAEAYGSGAYYVSTPEGEVFLLGSRLLSPLRNGGGVLLDRRVLGVERADIRKVRVSSADGNRELVHRYPDDPAKSYYADPAEPDVRLERASGWVAQALRLRTRESVDSEPAGEPALVIELIGASDVLARVELWPKNDSGEAYARSSRFERTLALNPAMVERLLDDTASVLEDRGDGS